jgi:putative transcriptional regulator
MNALKAIRERLEVTQAELGAAVKVSQGNVSFYERGQTVPPDVAERLIAFAASKGLPISYDHIYGAIPIPAVGKPKRRAPKPATPAQEVSHG